MIALVFSACHHHHHQQLLLLLLLRAGAACALATAVAAPPRGRTHLGLALAQAVADLVPRRRFQEQAVDQHAVLMRLVAVARLVLDLVVKVDEVDGDEVLARKVLLGAGEKGLWGGRQGPGAGAGWG